EQLSKRLELLVGEAGGGASDLLQSRLQAFDAVRHGFDLSYCDSGEVLPVAHPRGRPATCRTAVSRIGSGGAGGSHLAVEPPRRRRVSPLVRRRGRVTYLENGFILKGAVEKNLLCNFPVYLPAGGRLQSGEPPGETGREAPGRMESLQCATAVCRFARAHYGPPSIAGSRKLSSCPQRAACVSFWDGFPTF